MYKSGKENRGLFCSLLCFYVSGCGLKSPALISSYDPNRLTAGGVRMTLARHMPYGQSSEKFATLHKNTPLTTALKCFFFFWVLLPVQGRRQWFFMNLCSIWSLFYWCIYDREPLLTMHMASRFKCVYIHTLRLPVCVPLYFLYWISSFSFCKKKSYPGVILWQSKILCFPESSPVITVVSTYSYYLVSLISVNTKKAYYHDLSLGSKSVWHTISFLCFVSWRTRQKTDIKSAQSWTVFHSVPIFPQSSYET